MIVRALAHLPERRALPESPGFWRNVLYGGLPTQAGPPVSESSALQLATVFSCVNFLSSNAAALPLCLFKREGKSRKKAIGHPLYRRLHSLANPRTTAFQLKQFSFSQLMLRGNAVSFPQRDAGGNVSGIFPMRWDHVAVDWSEAAGQLRFRWQPPGRPSLTFLASQVWHETGLSMDSKLGISPIAATRETFGAGLAMQAYASRYFANGAVPSVVLKHPGKLGSNPVEQDASYERLRSSFGQAYTGEGQHRAAILEEGMDLSVLSITPEDSQLLETRKFSREEIAQIFGIPPHLVGILDKATFSNIEQQSLDFVLFHLTPWLVAIEQTAERDLLTEAEREAGYYIKHLVDGLLRGDTATRVNAHRVAVTTGWMNRNEVRELEELDPADGLDEFLVPLFMGPEPVDGAKDGPNQPGARPQPGQAIPKAPPARALPAPSEHRRLPERALAPVFVDAFGRLVRAELRELRKLLAKASEETLGADLDALYAEGSAWSQLASAILGPPLRALGSEEDELAIARRIGAAVGRHAGASRQALATAAAGGSGARARIETVVAAWSERPAVAAAEELRRATAGEG